MNKTSLSLILALSYLSYTHNTIELINCVKSNQIPNFHTKERPYSTMESITNLTNAASRAIWGEGEQDPNSTSATSTTPRTTESGSAFTGSKTTGAHSPTDSSYTTGNTIREPISGHLGNTSAGEPYDKGNDGKCN